MGRTIVIQFRAGSMLGLFSLCHGVQIGSGTQPASCPMSKGGRGLFPGDKPEGVWSQPLTSI